MHLLEHKFELFPGIGPKTEAQLKSLGISSWEHCIPPFTKPPLTKHQRKLETLHHKIQTVREAIAQERILELAALISKSWHWLLIPYVQRKIAYLDIETTGLSIHRNKITTIAVYDGKQTYDFVNGENLEEFPAFIRQFPVLATYYGQNFDLPFCQHFFQMEFPHLHFDLCFLARRVKLTGGLKGVEQQLGLGRKESAGVTGYTAVLLWKKYVQTKDRRYLETLLAYNNEDVYSLEFILREVYNRLCYLHSTDATTFHLPMRPLFTENPYHQDAEILQKLL